MFIVMANIFTITCYGKTTTYNESQRKIDKRI